MEVKLFLLLLGIHFAAVGLAVHPGCECLIYSNTHGKPMGYFTTPDYPKPYLTNIDCILYTFIGRPNEIIQITFEDFDIKSQGHDCNNGDYVRLFLHLDSGEVNEYTPWETTLCGDKDDIPTVLYSSGPGLVLEFHSGDQTTNSRGFSGTFRFMDSRLFKTTGQKLPASFCDYQFANAGSTDPSYGNFYSPNYPSSYPKNVKCSYYFRARNKERIQLVFEEISLQKGDISCLNRADIIKVYDGLSANAAAIKFLCNEALEVEILSTGPNLFVEFVANSDWPGHGFKARYQFQPVDQNFIDGEHGDGKIKIMGPSVSETRSSCDLSFNSDTTKNGTISSPHYPDTYPSRTSCSYEFEGKGNERIRILFIDFQLGSSKHVLGGDCSNEDSLVAYVHVEGKTEIIQTSCGSVVPKSIMSNGPRMLIQLKSMFGGYNARGFRAIYTFTENYGITTGVQIPDYPCAFVFTRNQSKSGYFHSPNYPGLYPRDTECHYFFYGNDNELVHLRFQDFDVEGNLPCATSSASDYVEFSNYMSIDKLYSRHCGDIVVPFVVDSTRQFFRVTFRSNARLDGTGFNASYIFVDKMHTHNVTTTAGTLQLVGFRTIIFAMVMIILILGHFNLTASTES